MRPLDLRTAGLVTAAFVSLATATSAHADVTERVELSAAAFHQVAGDPSLHHSYYMAGPAHYLASLNLPANAMVTRFTGFVDDQATGNFETMSLYLYKTTPSAFTSTLMAELISADGINGVQAPTTTNIDAARVGAGNAVYVELILPSSGQPIYVTGAKIVYTVPSPLTPTR